MRLWALIREIKPCRSLFKYARDGVCVRRLVNMAAEMAGVMRQILVTDPGAASNMHALCTVLCTGSDKHS